MKRILKSLIIIVILLGSCNMAQAQNSPQIYNNLFLSMPISEDLILRSDLSFNILYLDPSAWNELSASSTIAKEFKGIIEATAGLYLARVQQNEELSNGEIRPVIGFRIFTRAGKRYRLGNYSRLEFRYLLYSDNLNDGTARFRNRTTLAMSINRAQINTPDKNLFAFSYFEVFNNFEDDTRERFFKQFKIKLGLAYRINRSWSIDLGVIYLDSQNNLETPTQLPTIVDTNYIVEWQLAYSI